MFYIGNVLELWKCLVYINGKFVFSWIFMEMMMIIGEKEFLFLGKV